MPKNPVTPVVKFVAKHRVALAVTATAIVMAKLNQSVIQQHNDFLKEHNLYETFYTPTEED